MNAHLARASWSCTRATETVRVVGLPSNPITSTHSQKSVSKETYYSIKRDLLQCQKRPTLRT